MFRYVDALCLLPLTMYPKTHIARARHLIYFHPDSLLHQCKKVMSLLKHVEFISFVMYNVESILLSSYVVWRNDLLIHTMLLDGFILLESFVTPAGISMGIKLRTEFFSHIMSN